MTHVKGDRFGDSNVVGVDMPNWDLNELKLGHITAFSDNSVTITAANHEYKLTGHDFVFAIFGGDVSLDGGTIETLDARGIPDNGSPQPELRIYDFSMDVGDFNNFVEHDSVHAFKRALLSGSDHLRGGGNIDHLTGLGGHDDVAGGSGDDVLEGGRGHDHLQGDGGADLMIGGRGHDNYQIDGADDSGGGVYDTIDGFNADRDHIVVPGGVSGIDPWITAGVATGPDVDATLEAGLADHLGAHHAVLATVEIGPSSTIHFGTEVFLVIDQNGIAGYQAGEDIAIHMINGHHPRGLGVEDFLVPH